MALARDIDQEVSETLCTLLSFDEDNFLSQEEVEENLRNCPTIGHDSTIEKIYQDHNNGSTANNNKSSIDDTTHNQNEAGGSTTHKHGELPEVDDEEQKQLDQILRDDDQMDTTDSDIYAHKNTEFDAARSRSLESALNTLIAAAVADDPTSILSQESTRDIKSEFVYESEQINEEILPPQPSPVMFADTETKYVNEPQPEEETQLSEETQTVIEPQLKPEFAVEPQTDVHPPPAVGLEADVEPQLMVEPESNVALQVQVEPQVKVEPQLIVEPQVNIEPQLQVEPEVKMEPQLDVEPQLELEGETNAEPLPEHVFNPQDGMKIGDASPNIINEHVDVKLEFTCESEQLFEENMARDYYIEDEFKKDVDFVFDLTQIEIDSQDEICEEDDKEVQSIDLLDNSLLSQSMDHSIASNEERNFNKDDDQQISNIMSDHNYTSQEKTANRENLQKLLVNHIISSKGSAVSMKVVTDFVEKTLESIQLLPADNESQADTSDANSGEDFTDLINIFADEKSTNTAIFDANLKGLAEKPIEKDTISTTEEAGNETYEKEKQKELDKSFADNNFSTAGDNDLSLSEDMVYKTMSLASIASPQANCSEPLEHSMKSTTTDSINANQLESSLVNDNVTNSTEPNNLITETETQTEKNMQPESGAISALMELEEGCDENTAPEQVVCSAASNLENVTEITPHKGKAFVTADTAVEEDVESMHSDTALEEDVESMQAEPVENQERSTKIAVFNKELEQMDMEVRQQEIDDAVNTTEVNLGGDEDRCKTKPSDNAILTDKLASIAGTDLCVADSQTTSDINEFKAMNISSVPSPLEYCSEPLEHTTFDDAFDLNCKEKLTISHHLHTLKSFAKSLHDDCETFTSSTTTIESKLQKYMQEQLEIFKKIVRAATAYRCEEKSIQTDERLSKRKIRKLTQSNKQCLINPTAMNGSSSDDADLSSAESSIKSQITARTRRRVSHSNSQLNSTQSATQSNFENSKKECIAADYDDGVALADYTQSEVFETETFCNDSFTHIRKINTNDSLSDDDNDDGGVESDLDDTWHRKKSNSNTNVSTSTVHKASQNESDKENSVVKTIVSNHKSSPKDAGDKDIERLINLNGLIKRSNLGVGKSRNDRVKTKSINSKNKDIIESFTDDDIHAEIFSDPSQSESEEEITETQFLKRCNENVKQQLLSDSDSDNTESDANADIEEILSSDERSNSPLVDRFLKNFNVNESEDEESEKSDNNKSSTLNETTDLNPKLTDKNKSNSSENSDCEMLDDMVPTTNSKHIKPRSLEKMLSVIEKKKKMNRLCDSISLSSESESSSDVEAVEETKSRIKPMLRPEQLATVTREAQRNESERIRRLEKKHKTLTKLIKERPDVQEDCNLILDYNEETKTFIKVHPDIVKHLKQHQREGVRFMYDSCYGGIEALKKSTGSGCILAHCMGLGKTLQLIALLHTVISYKELKTAKVLVLCPKSTVMNWADEIERWLGPLKPKYYTFNDTSDVNDKIQILKDWSASTLNKAGILLIGYEAFRTLVFYHSYKNRGIPQARLDSIRNDVDKYLLSPGADLVVCDEGHIIKNSKSAISLAVTQIKTPKRIVLTGTPIQNNLKEYYSMVNFIKPLFLGTEKEFANLYANPIKNGQHKDSSKRDIQVMKQRSFVLHKKLSKFVQRKEAELLKTFLPQKYEYVLFIPMTKVQTILYEHILTIISKKEDKGKGLITDYTCLRKIWTHPKVLEDAWRNATTQKHRKDSRKTPAAVHSDDEQPDDVYDSQTGVISVTNDWWRNLLDEKDLETILPSNKLRTMFEILRMCEEKGEKCLIFSAFVAVLNVVEYFFKKMNDKDADTLNELKMSQGYQVKNTWILGKDYYRLDGKTPKLLRHAMIEQFNSLANKRARVFLISSRAGGQGINLTGANRVIILDTSWNPSNDQQNIFRVFRLGQKKNCYIYRLIAMGTMEEKVYSRSVTKQAMSFRVVDEQQIDRHYSMAELTELYSLTTPDYENRPMPDCPQDTILASLLLNYPSLVYKYHEHDSLLENKVEQELSEQEKQDAWAAYERDQQMNSEIREMPNPDELQNNLAAPKFPPYLGSSLSAFNQMSALFNYSNFSPASLSPYLPTYLSHLSNYTASNQQYLEMRKRLAEGTFPYPDISTSLGTTPFTTPFGQNAPKSLTTNPLIPDLSNLHNSALHTNPLSALGDLSMFGLGNANNHMTAAHNVNTSQQQRQHTPPTYASTTTNPTTASNMQANFDYQMYENSLKSLVNYRHDFSAANGSATNKSKSGNIPPMPVQAFKNPLYAQMNAMNYDKNSLAGINSPSPSMEQQQQQQQSQKQQYADKNTGGKSASSTDNATALPLTTRNIDKNNFGNVGNSSAGGSGGARSSPLPQVATKRTYNDVNISHVRNTNEGRSTPNSKSAKESHHGSGGLTNFQSFKNNNNSTASNSGNSSYKNLTTGKSSNDNMNNNKSSMQIIPTTSPPGTSSITKQYTDISPSISLTAVTSSSSSANKTSNNTNFNQSKNQTNKPSSNKTTTNTNNNNSNNKSSELKKSSTPYTFQKFLDIKKPPPPNRPVSKTTDLSTKTKSHTPTFDLIAKATAAMKATTPTTTTQQTTQNAHQQNPNEIGSKLLTAVNNARNKNLLQKKPQNLTVQQVRSGATTTTSTARTPTTITAVKTSANAGSTSISKLSATSKSAPATQQSDARRTGGAAMEKRLESLNRTTPSQSSSSAHALKSGSSSASSAALKIQPNSANKASTSSASASSGNDNMLTYILETCINQKKFAIGAPTKGGGGTTVTRVQTQGKRKNPESIPKDAGSNETKRAK